MTAEKLCTNFGFIITNYGFIIYTQVRISNYKLFVNPLFKLISIEHVIIGSKTQWKTM